MKKLFTLFFALVASVGTMTAGIIKIDNLYYFDSIRTTFIPPKTFKYDTIFYLTSSPEDDKYTGDIVIPSSVPYHESTIDVTVIGYGAFANCTGLTSITIPNSVTSIGDNAFSGCKGLTSPVYNAHLFAYLPLSYSGTYTIPDGIKSIVGGAFSGCTGLIRVEIPNSVTSIGGNAFSGCSGLTAVTISDSVTSIENNAFSGCTSLTNPVYNEHVFAYLPPSYSGEYTLPDGIESFVGGAFNDCSRLSITIPNSYTSIYNGMFSGCTSLTSITIPNSVTSIGKQAFYSCTGLTSITLGNSVTSIGEQAFSGCSGLTSVTIPNSITSIGNETFSGCSGLTSVTIPEGVIRIGDMAFYYCSSLKSVTIPNSVTSIGGEAFCDCWRLARVTIPESVTSIGMYAFRWCTRLASVTIPNSVTNIGNLAFEEVTNIIYDGSATGSPWGAENVNGCVDGWLVYTDTSKTTLLACFKDAIGEITIPNTVTRIRGGAFHGCTGITSVTIPNSVTSIEGMNFYDCTSLTSITLESSIPPTLDNGLDPVSYPLYVPCGTLEDYQNAKNWSNYATQIKYVPNPYTITIVAENGSIAVSDTTICEEETHVIAIPDYGYYFAQWSDGNKDNPRSIILTQDTTLTAEFAIAKSGTCGDELALKWEYEDKSKSLTISGSGSLNSNYLFGLEAPTQMRTLVIGNEVTEIGDSAFFGMKTINHLTIGANVAAIGNYAFSECKNFDDITCYANDVPEINATTFANIGNKQYIYLYVPEGRQRAYQRDEYWGEFDVQVKEAETTQTDDVKVTPDATTADVVWPQVDNAYTYELVIKDKDGNIVCALVFNAQGQLTSIAFNAPARGDAPQKTQTAGFAFTVTGLESGKAYDYTLTAKNEGGTVLKVESGSFTTNAPQGIEEVENATKATKIIREGQVLIQKGEKVFDLRGQEVR